MLRRCCAQPPAHLCSVLDLVHDETRLLAVRQVGEGHQCCGTQVAKFERIVRGATAEALQLHDPDAELLFAYCLGSYCRGKPATG